MLSFGIDQVGGIAADDAPAEATGWEIHFVHYLNDWRWLFRTLLDRVQFQV